MGDASTDSLAFAEEPFSCVSRPLESIIFFLETRKKLVKLLVVRTVHVVRQLPVADQEDMQECLSSTLASCNMV